MSTTCALCQRRDWLDVGICAACAGTAAGDYVFVTPSFTRREEAEQRLRDLLGSQVAEQSTREVSRGRQALALLPRALALRAARALESAGLRVRVLPRNELHRAVPGSFAVMVFAIILAGTLAGVRGVPLLLAASPVLAATLVFAACWQLGTPLLVTPATSALLPESARASLADALAQLDDARARELLLSIARTGEAAFRALPEAFRTAALGESVVDLLDEAGPLAREAAHLREIATELDGRIAERNAAAARQIADAADARFGLLEDVRALLGRLARDGARSDDEVARLLQLVRDESARRIEAEAAVATLLGSA